MKKFTFSLSLILSCAFLNAQLGPSAQWTWVSGNSTTNQHASYGTKGTASPANVPGGRSGSTTWTDPSGKLWLFGGLGLTDTGSTSGYLNDLWKFDPATSQWTWISGDSALNPAGVYGTKGTAAATNKPGGRHFGISWVDGSGNLWLLGGEGVDSRSYPSGFGLQNDLWKFNPSISQWTFIAGDSISYNVGVYGTQGVGAAANKPGARRNGVSWTSGGMFWMAGGYGLDQNGTPIYLNDVWRYDPASNIWTWIRGTATVTGFSYVGSYGTQGTFALSNKPGGREGAVSWTNGRYLWMFGGSGLDSVTVGSSSTTAKGNLGDLWKFDTTSHQWSWISGPPLANQFSTYGSVGVPAVSNQPSGRNGAVGWMDASGNLGLFGGVGGTTATQNTSGRLNDLWSFNPTANAGAGEWTWMKGDSTADNTGIYGTLGTPAAANKPGGRYIAGTWTVNTDFWLFGGFGYSSSPGTRLLNDLWKISSGVIILPVNFGSFTATKSNGTAVLHWTTAQELNSSYFIVERSGDGTNFTSIGRLPAAGNFNIQTNYQFTDISPLSGTDYYRIKEVDIDGKFTYSVIRSVNFDNISLALYVDGNPFNSNLQFRINSFIGGNAILRLIDISGKTVWSKATQIQKGINSFSLDGSNYQSGIYILSVTTATDSRQVKVVKN
jgi:N-acetylneuraminic acid mutarotase